MSQPSIRRTLEAHTESYAAKAGVQALGIIATRGLANGLCDTPYPDSALCDALSDSIEKQTQDLTTTVWSCGVCALLSVWWESTRRN